MLHTVIALNRPELIIGLVGAAGCAMQDLETRIIQQLKTFSYVSKPVRVIELVHNFEGFEGHLEDTELNRYSSHIKQGISFCSKLGKKNSLMGPVVGYIVDFRKNELEKAESLQNAKNYAFILRSLKRPEEVQKLREIYGTQFILIAAFSSSQSRAEELKSRFAASEMSRETSEHLSQAWSLIEIDNLEANDEFGQRVSETFSTADFFIDLDAKTTIEKNLERFFRIIFSFTSHTPQKDEFSMFMALGASLRSGDTSRQVGASIVNESGEVLVVGTNEVPKRGGGQYWEGDPEDKRDLAIEENRSENLKLTVIADTLKRLKNSNWLAVFNVNYF